MSFFQLGNLFLKAEILCIKVKMNKSGYEDILEARRNEIANWMWSSRALKTQVAVKIVPRPTPQSHKLAVLQSPKIVECIKQVCL